MIELDNDMFKLLWLHCFTTTRPAGWRSDSCWWWKLPHIDHPCLWPCEPCFGWSSLPIVFPDPSLYTGVRSSWFHCMPHNNHGGLQSYASLAGDSVHNYQAGGFVLGFRWSLLLLRHSIRALLTACLTTKGKIVSCKHPAQVLTHLPASLQPTPPLEIQPSSKPLTSLAKNTSLNNLKNCLSLQYRRGAVVVRPCSQC